MFDPALTQLLKAKIPVLPQVVIERDLKHDIDELVASALPPMKLCVVDDACTREVSGERVFKALKGRFPCTHITLDSPAADESTLLSLHMQTLSSEALVAVGSGTISDLCKYASHKDNKPYVVFPTAASMNGYLSATASVTREGYKTSLAAHMPKAVFCDLSVISTAPPRLSKSGLGDSLARSTAQVDWLLSHLLLGTPYDETPFALLASLEPQLFESVRGIALGDMESIELLLKTLLLSGLGMTIAGGSYPASQGEHMIAHAMEMLPGEKSHAFHGEEIGVTTLTMARIQEKLLRGMPKLRLNEFNKEKMATLFGEKIAGEAKKVFESKLSRIRNCPSFNWDNVSEKITAVHVPSSRLESVLKTIQTSITPEDLQWRQKDYDIAVESARYLRDRFTFLDLEVSLHSGV